MLAGSVWRSDRGRTARRRAAGVLALCSLALGCSDPAEPPSESDAGASSGGAQVGGTGGGSQGGVSGGGTPTGGAPAAGGGAGGAAGSGSAAVSTLVATGYGNCGLDLEGTIHCWGATPGQWQIPTAFVDLRSGGSWVCAIRADRSYECFAEPFGNPGLLDFAPQVRVKDLSVTSGAICVLDEAGELTCDQASSGVGDITPPAGQKFSRVSVGSDFACGVLATNGGLVCWGNAGEATPDCVDVPAAGQLAAPPGPFVSLDSAGYTTCALDSTGTPKCWGAGESSDDAAETCLGAPFNHGQAAPIGQQYRSVRVGINHSCAVALDGSLACWGAGATDECTLDTNANCRQSRPPQGVFEHVAVGRTHSCAMTAERKVECWGNAGEGLPSSPGGRTEPPAVFQ